MDFALSAIQVVVGAFVFFTAARVGYGVLVPKAGWAWVLLVGALAVANMLLHRWLGSTINPPFFTAVLFAVTLAGLAPPHEQGASAAMPRGDGGWIKRAVIAVVVGTVIGWASFAEVHRAGG